MNTRCIMQQLAAAEAGWKVGPRSQLHWGWTWGPHDNIACCYKLGCPCLHLRPTEIHPSLSQFVLNFASLRCPAQSPSPKPAWRRDSWTSSSRRSSSCRRTTPWASSVAPRCAGSGVASSSLRPPCSSATSPTSDTAAATARASSPPPCASSHIAPSTAIPPRRCALCSRPGRLAPHHGRAAGTSSAADGPWAARCVPMEHGYALRHRARRVRSRPLQPWSLPGCHPGLLTPRYYAFTSNLIFRGGYGPPSPLMGVQLVLMLGTWSGLLLMPDRELWGTISQHKLWLGSSYQKSTGSSMGFHNGWERWVGISSDCKLRILP